VIDTIFDTHERREYLDFTPPYTSIEVPIYFRKEISGIADLKSARGFTVAAKTGDHAAELLKANGVEDVQLFHNYEAIIEAAKEHKTNVFVIDSPPADYYLNKLGIEDEFRHSPPINIGKFHRAVRKGDTALLDTLLKGFAAIGSKELDRINEHWLGRSILSRRYVTYAGYVALAAILSLAAVLVWNRTLRLRVNRRTEALRQSEEKLLQRLHEIEQIYAHSPIGLFSFDRDYRFIRINERMAEINGFSVAEHAGKTLDEIVPELAGFLRETFRPIFERGEPVLNVEIHGKTPKDPDHERDWLGNYFPLKSESGVVIGLMGAVLEITNRKQAEKALRESEERFRQLAETVPEVFWMTDGADQELLYVSPAYETIWGRTCASLYESPRSWMEAIHPDDRERMTEALGARRPGNNYEQTYRILRPDGTIRWIRERAFPVRGEGGEILRIAGTSVDITERRQLEEQLRQSQKMEAIGHLSSGVAHDFNNILTAIQMNASLLGMADGIPAEAVDYARDIETAVQRAAGLTRQLLAFGRSQVMNVREIDLNSVVRTMAKMLQRVIGENVELHLRIADSPLFMEGDSGMIEQVLLNLCLNARDAMPEGGLLRIETTRVLASEHARPGLKPNGTTHLVRLLVRDTGHGMTPEVKAHIFEPFYTTKGVGRGTGLGLAAVHGIVHQHHGFVEVDTVVGKGTEFRVFLPLLPEKTRELPGKKAAPIGKTTPSGHETILVVEDEASVRFLVTTILNRAGYRVIEAENGIVALEVWRAHKDEIQLLMTDIVMPDGMTGIDLARLIREAKPDLPVLFSSGYSPDAVREGMTMQEGVNFLPKPFDVDRMLETVRRCIESEVRPGS